MSVDPAATAAHLCKLLEARSAAPDERSRAALRIARTVAGRLVEAWGVTRVYLFGSAARGEMGEGSDIDLAVVGLAPGRLIDAGVDVEALAAPFMVDLVPLERLSLRWRDAIEREGIRLP